MPPTLKSHVPSSSEPPPPALIREVSGQVLGQVALQVGVGAAGRGPPTGVGTSLGPPARQRQRERRVAHSLAALPFKRAAQERLPQFKKKSSSFQSTSKAVRPLSKKGALLLSVAPPQPLCSLKRGFGEEQTLVLSTQPPVLTGDSPVQGPEASRGPSRLPASPGPGRG